MKYRIVYILFFLLFWVTSVAQTIDIQLPYYAAREYYFCLQKGARQDTVARGVLNYAGKATIDLTQSHPSYRGVGRLSVREYGKIWSVVINGNEKIIMTEPSTSDGGESDASPSFAGSPENSFLLDAFAHQNKIVQEYADVVNSSQSQSFVLAPSDLRLSMLESQYKAFRKEVADSKLYAARLVEILNCLTGMGSSFNVSQEDVLDEQHQFIVNKVDFNDLYASGFWQPVLETWVQIASADDTVLLADARRMLDRCGNDIFIRREVTQAIIRLLSKYGKDSLLAELGTEYLTMPLNGQLAPEIVTAAGSFLPTNSLIIFYETGCGSCHYEIEQLKGKYQLLLDNDLRVISIAADMGKEVHEETAAKLPWSDKLCDFKGFDGANFANYGIVGTPTYILTDKEGIVRGRYAQLKELF